MAQSDLEALLEWQFTVAQGIAERGWVVEHRFAPPRRWRFDFAFPDEMLAVEVEGGTWVQGRHSRGSAFTADCIKYAEAMILGWRVLRVTGDMVSDGTAVELVRRALLVPVVIP